MRCGQYARQSHIKIGRYFWWASMLAFLTIIRRELNFLPELFVPSHFMLLAHSYDWWEDVTLLVIYVLTLGLLVYGRRYLWGLLKATPMWLYLIITSFAALQYIGEHAIALPETLGIMVEEVAENIVYAIALLYLWHFDLNTFNQYLDNNRLKELPFNKNNS